MSREIKFRVWDTVENKFFVPTYEAYAGRLEDLSIDLSGRLIRRTLEMPAEDESRFTGRYILNQYTALKDEDDKEIYEFDKISFAIFDHNGADTQYTGVVVFSDGQWQIWNSIKDPYFGSDGPFNLHLVWYNYDGIKVIGNVYEEVNTNESESSFKHHTDEQQEEKEADKG